MAYITESVLLKEIKKDHLDLLLKPGEGDTTTRAEILANAIQKSDGIVNGYLLGVVKTVPMAAPPDNIIDASTVICIYNLHGRIDYGDIPDYWMTRYNSTIDFLKRVQDGKANVVVDTEQDTKQDSVEYFTQGRNFYDDTF